MKFKEIKQLATDDLDKKLTEWKKELMKLKAQVATGTPPQNTGRIRAIKRDFARVLTAQNQK